MSLRDDLIREEGRKSKLYRCPAGKLTGGVGHNFDDLGIPEPIIDALLDYDIAQVTAQLDKELPWWRGRPQKVQDAMANLAFQLGLNGLLKFKQTLACLHAGDWAGAKKAALDSAWAKQTPERAKRITELFTDK